VEAGILTTADGVSLAATFRRASAPRGTVVVAHGFSASAEHADITDLGTHLHARGFDVVTYDARGHGRSGGKCTLGDLERNDVAAAVEAARRESGRIVLLGMSMGAIAVLRHGVDDPAIAGIVTVSCPAHWKLPRNARGVLSAGITSTPPGRAFAARRLGVRIASRRPRPAPPVELVDGLGAPVAIVHGEGDPFIAASNARDLYDAASEPRRLAIVPGTWHAYDPTAVPEVLDAVDWVIASGRP
jgi:alpha-beta hydrolase superfamily lysophospholipase